MGKRKKKKVEVSKFDEFVNRNKNLIGFGLIIILVLTAVGALLIFTKKDNKNGDYENPISYKGVPINKIEKENFAIRVDEDGITPKEATLIKGKMYNFQITKSLASTCTGLQNIQIGYILNLNKSINEYYLTLPESKEYTFKCVDKNISMKIKVRNND